MGRRRSFRLIVGHLRVDESQNNKSFKPFARGIKGGDNDSPMLFNVMDDLLSGHVSANVCCHPGIVPANSVSCRSRTRFLWIGFVRLT
jgi:hypothetical protein